MLPGGFSGGDEPDGSGKFIATAFRSERVRHAVDRLLNDRDGLMLGICNGFQALIKLGLVPYGEIRELKEDDPTLTYNTLGRHISRMVYTRVTSVKSPWLSLCNPGDIHAVPISHGEGRFMADPETVRRLAENGQTQRSTVVRRPGGTSHRRHHLEPQRLGLRHRGHHLPRRPGAGQDGPQRTPLRRLLRQRPRRQGPETL